MEQSSANRLKLGDPLNGTVVKSAGGRRFAVKSSGIPAGWKVELHTKHPERIRPGDLGTFWIAKISPYHRSVLVHDGDFGKLPISDSMGPRYAAGIKALLTGEGLTGEVVSDAHSMVLRVDRRDQGDWLSVWRVLGEPESGDVKILLAAIQSVREARKESPEELPAKLESLRAQFGDRLELAMLKLTRPS